MQSPEYNKVASWNVRRLTTAENLNSEALERSKVRLDYRSLPQ